MKTLEAENLTLSQYRDQVRERVIIQAMRGHKTQQTVVVSPHKMEKYYSENLDQYKVGDQIKLRMIFIKPNPPQSGFPTFRGRPKPPPPPIKQGNGNRLRQHDRPGRAFPIRYEFSEPVPAPSVDFQRELAEEIFAKFDAGDSFEISRAFTPKAKREGRKAATGAGLARTSCARNSTKLRSP